MTGKRWQRSRDAVAGGVCAGLADVLGIDAVVVRILAVLLCLITVGLGAVVYIVLWVLMPLAPEDPLPLDVRPHEATSETYGAIDVAPDDGAKGAASPKTDVSARRDVYAAAGHVPPQPPLGAQAAAAAVASRIAAGIAPTGDLQAPPAPPLSAQAVPPDAAAPEASGVQGSVSA